MNGITILILDVKRVFIGVDASIKDQRRNFSVATYCSDSNYELSIIEVARSLIFAVYC